MMRFFLEKTALNDILDYNPSQWDETKEYFFFKLEPSDWNIMNVAK